MLLIFREKPVSQRRQEHGSMGPATAMNDHKDNWSLPRFCCGAGIRPSQWVPYMVTPSHALSNRNAVPSTRTVIPVISALHRWAGFWFPGRTAANPIPFRKRWDFPFHVTVGSFVRYSVTGKGLHPNSRFGNIRKDQFLIQNNFKDRQVTTDLSIAGQWIIQNICFCHQNHLWELDASRILFQLRFQYNAMDRSIIPMQTISSTLDNRPGTMRSAISA